MTVLSDLVDLVLTLGEEKELPAVRGLYKPRPARPTGRPKKFGVIALDDGSCGWTYTDAYEACVAGLDGDLPDVLETPLDASDQSSEGPSDASAEDAEPSGPPSDVDDDATGSSDSSSEGDAGTLDTSETADAEIPTDAEATDDEI